MHFSCLTETLVYQETGVIFTHHQKTVIVDADAGGKKRKIIAFVGGLDLCGGRYDNPKHPLFSTLQTLHKDDYHNPNFTVILFVIISEFRIIHCVFNLAFNAHFVYQFSF